MTYIHPSVPESSNRFPPEPYPVEYPAVRPEDVAPYDCDHDVPWCRCVHDWRINWGNLPKRTKARATYITE